MTPLPYSDERHQRAYQFLVEEAYLLDSGLFEDWLELLDVRIEYRMPVRVTALKVVDEVSVQTMDHFFEDGYALRKRVERFATRSAWTEDPQSRVRHHVGNVRTFDAAEDFGDSALRIESSLLVFRSRGDRNPPDILSAGRDDIVLTSPDNRLLLRRRHISVDESVLRMQNLAVFL